VHSVSGGLHEILELKIKYPIAFEGLRPNAGVNNYQDCRKQFLSIL